MQAYLDAVQQVIDHGEERPDRTGVGTRSCFAVHLTHDLSQGFPLLTTKKVNYAAVLHELLWFLQGDTHIRDLRQKTKIWDAWTSEQRNWSLGRTYGSQWVEWEQYLDDGKGGYRLEHINQIQLVIDALKKNPYSRRMVVSAWNPGDFERPKDDPKRTVQPSACHTIFMFYVTADRRLCCHLTQRSGDLMLGVPFNLASYSTLTQMLAQEAGLGLGMYSHTINDCHIYKNHLDGAREQITRDPLPLPTLKIAKKPFWDLKFEDFELVNYQSHPSIKFPIAV